MMTETRLLLGVAFATVGWMFISQFLGEPIGRWIYAKRVERSRENGETFESQAAMEVWVKNTALTSFHWGLLGLAAITGSVAGAVGFPLVGFSRSTNGWSWARIIALCATSWVVAGWLHPGLF